MRLGSITFKGRAGLIMALCIALWLQISTSMAATLDVPIGLLGKADEGYIPLTRLEPRLDDDGLAGARQGIRDNNTTGRFTGQEFTLHALQVDAETAAAQAFRQLYDQGVRLFLVDLPLADLVKLADLPLAQDSLLFNIGANDDELRVSQCRANLLHTAPSRAMLADALAQYLAWKRWNRWFLVVGKQLGDQAFAKALERAAKRFGGKIRSRKAWTFDAGARRTDSGHVKEQQAVNAFTQVDDYDILLVADESDLFGEYLDYRTYLPRPMGGTHGLRATAWSGVHEQWGATQFQRRFQKKTGRWMTPLDFAAWLAVRSIGEATTRIKRADAVTLREYLLSSEFKLGAFKGVPVSYRDWNGQLRQPLLIVSHRLLVSVSPQAGFLHQFSFLDTLGYDRMETRCASR